MDGSSPPPSPFLFASIPARWVDQLIRYTPQFGLSQSLKESGARALSLLISQTVFPLFTALDFARYSSQSFLNRTYRNLPYGSENLAEIDEAISKADQVAFKCLRGLVTFPTGIIWRDMVTNHFLPQTNPDGKIHPKGGLYSSQAVIVEPQTQRAVQQLVQVAAATGQKVSIRGAGFSQGKQTLPPRESDLHLNMHKLNKITIDPETRIATVGAGATWKQLQGKADPMGLAVQVMQASNPFSIGGSLSANCHGWDHTQGSLANTICSLTIVNAQGEIENLTPDDELFSCVVGGYGLFGVITEVKVQLTTNDQLFDFGVEVPIEDYTSYFREHIEQNPAIKMHLYRLSLEGGRLLSKGWAQNYSTAFDGAPSDQLTDEPEGGTTQDRILVQIARNSPTARNLWWQQEERNLQQIRKATRNQIMRPPIHALFANESSAHQEWLQEYFVSESSLPSFLEFLGETLNENEVGLLNASVRFVKKEERALLGYAHEEDRFAVVLCFSQSLNEKEVKKTEHWVQKVVDQLRQIGGTFYLPYMHFPTKEQFQDCYPQWEELLEKKELYDPNHLFDNGFFQDYFPQPKGTSPCASASPQ